MIELSDEEEDEGMFEECSNSVDAFIEELDKQIEQKGGKATPIQRTRRMKLIDMLNSIEPNS